ncbi:hypothetical protein SpiGrapes_0173 [Sphaerochaeta pleomorpha str. Grapes]|uniref:DUF1850 domain-containing protein n=1 Tax=Sphaerochaeta pleomorpha (strain ATCC BAA-1885 / DSM 22778 / Grapes) TaxID=158190 RepID=G8QTS2_SPHPG|nr:DUF1850 domain-containing protein [Sphaerochaeta pleomorpha]AEV28037.1 hypothetical protein SpiGrapes_0173 [Sphaerochaeta pleomorpha str. Grapes]
MKRIRITGRQYIAFLVIGFILLFFLFFSFKTEKTLTIQHQDTKTTYLEIKVQEGDSLTFYWMHSFEHIPWNEYYVLGKDNRLVLQKFEVAGFGAGIPENEGTVSVENGMVVMSDLNTVFNDIHWIHSQTALIAIMLKGTVIARGTDLPHREPLILKMKGSISLCPRFHSKQ